MVNTGDIYERELKYLLAGDKKIVAKMVNTCNSLESGAYKTMLMEPFLVIRAAGSLGVDLVALRWDFSFPIEVKSSNEDVLHFSRNHKLTEQANKMQDTCSKSHLVPIYAFRLKGFRGDPWRIFTIPCDEKLRGRNILLRERLPKLEITKSGNYVMRWNDGMKLSDFISYMGLEDYDSE